MKILIIQQKMIGDVLTSSILFEALRKKYPRAQLDYLVQPHTIAAVENNPFISELIVYRPEENKNPIRFQRFLQKIRKKNYQVVIDVYSKISTAIISKASGAPQRISYYKWYTSSFYSHTVLKQKKSKTKAGLAVENRMLLLQALDDDYPKEIKPKIYLSKEEKIASKTLLRQAGITQKDAVIMVGVLGSSKAKTYPLQYLAQVLDDIVEKTGAQLLFNYIPKQKEDVVRLYELCEPKTKKNIHLEVFGKNLREFLALTSQCDGLIGNEGGAVNMAKALNIPTFSIFSPQISKEAWAIYEDEKNVSVHLKDHRPEFFVVNQKPSDELYPLFKPNFILPELHKFLKKTGLF